MPGRREPLEDAFEEIRRSRIARIACLAPADEITSKSPSYASAIEAKKLPCEHRVCEIPDFGVPANRAAFIAAVQETASCLRAGQSVLVHCGAGIGRTGMFAICVLLSLGVRQKQAEQAIRNAGSSPERPEQHKLISWFERSYSTVSSK
jgi:protein-tyrosine phosphatase